MPTLDVFNQDAFSLMSLTAAINKAPYKPSRIGQLGLFGEQRISTTQVMVEELVAGLSERTTLRRAVVALKDPEFVKKQEGLGAIVVNDARSNPADHKKFVLAEVAKWGPVIKAAGQYAD